MEVEVKESLVKIHIHKDAYDLGNKKDYIKIQF